MVALNAEVSAGCMLANYQIVCATLCREVLVMVMRKHQRYFPVYDAESKLLPVFITVANGSIHRETVIAGSLLTNHAAFYSPSFA